MSRELEQHWETDGEKHSLDRCLPVSQLRLASLEYWAKRACRVGDTDLSSVRRRIAKGYLVFVEGTWFDRQGALPELSGVRDGVAGELFELTQGVTPHTAAMWGSASARMKTALECGSTHMTPPLERLFTGALEGAEGRNTYMACLAEVHQRDAVGRGPVADPIEDPEQLVLGRELPEAEEKEQEELDQLELPGMTRVQHIVPPNFDEGDEMLTLVLRNMGCRSSS